MTLDRRFKEAFKVALAFAAVYGIALNAAWMNPSWAGFGVAMIVLQSAGQSIHKGLDRLAGTVPGCIAALVILALAPQERWLFMTLAALWVFFTTYRMIRSKNHSYFWNVAGFVCLVILLTGPVSSDNDFEHAVFRTLETALGIVTYTLISVFIWPVNNFGSIRQGISKLANTFKQHNQTIWTVLASRSDSAPFQKLHQQSIQQLQQFSQALIAEGSESYQVHEMRPALQQLHEIATLVVQSQDRLEINLETIAHIEVISLFPDLQEFFLAQDQKLDQLQQFLDTGKADKDICHVELKADQEAIHKLSALDAAGIVILAKELRRLDSLLVEMLDCIKSLGENAIARKPARSTRPWLPVFDRDHLRGASFVALCLIAGFTTWIFLNPPGHSAWLELPAIIAMMVAATQQTRTTAFFKPFAIMLTLALAVYVFVLPQLSSFVGLGLTLFFCAFVAHYFFTGIAQLAGMVAIINMVSIQNQQSYDFAAQANALVFTLSAFFLVYVMSYLMGSPRPEKTVLKMTRRFFGSASVLFSQWQPDDHKPLSAWQRWRLAYHRNELESLPDKIQAWGDSIDYKLFPGTSPEQVAGLVTSMRSLVYRIGALLDNPLSSADSLAESQELITGFSQWTKDIEQLFERWSQQPEAKKREQDEQKVNAIFKRLVNRIPADKAEQLYSTLGSFRGITDAATSFSVAAQGIDWEQWREERFS